MTVNLKEVNKVDERIEEMYRRVNNDTMQSLISMMMLQDDYIMGEYND